MRTREAKKVAVQRMRWKTSEILWHKREPVLGVHLNASRLATAGADQCVRIWSIGDAVVFRATLARYVSDLHLLNLFIYHEFAFTLNLLLP